MNYFRTKAYWKTFRWDKLINFGLGIVATGVFFYIVIFSMLYVEWAGRCVREKNAQQQNINLCLNPYNW